MEKEFTLKSEFTFKFKEEDCIGVMSIKEALEKGLVKIEHSRISLTEPNGYSVKDGILDQIRQALIYGLKEKV